MGRRRYIRARIEEGAGVLREYRHYPLSRLERLPGPIGDPPLSRTAGAVPARLQEPGDAGQQILHMLAGYPVAAGVLAVSVRHGTHPVKGVKP